MIYLESCSPDPAYNLALEQYAFDALSVGDDVFMLWQNRDAVIVGLHQNTLEEINGAFIEANGIAVVRRLSGGGAVFHDLGNLNYTIITKAPAAPKLDFRVSCEPVIKALRELGVDAEAGGRNDITVGGGKISGSARYLRDGRLMHHGTILFDTDLDRMSEALRVPIDKYASKGVKSVRARVTNLRRYLPRDMTFAEFWAFLRKSVCGDAPARPLTERDVRAVENTRKSRYAAWDWNYGRSPEFDVVRRRRIEGFGTITLSMRVENGKISAFATYGDYFGNRPYDGVAAALLGVPPEKSAVSDALGAIDLTEYYEGLSRDELIRLIIGG